MQSAKSDSDLRPTKKVKVREVFGIDSDMEAPAFAEGSEYVPDFDEDYLFDESTTLAILAGFAILFAIIELIESAKIPAPYDLVDLGLSSIMIFLAYSFVSSAKEAARRLKQLVDDPSSNVRPMPVSFLELIFNLR